MTREACQLTQVLAWAARHGLPFDDAIEGHLKSQGGPNFFAWLIRIFGLTFGPWYWPRARHQHVLEWRLKKLLKDLRKGSPLSEALRRRMAVYLPDYYLPVLEVAEASDALPQVLTNLEQSMKRELKLNLLSRSTVVYLFSYGFVAFFIVSGLLVFIIPKFAIMYDEMLEGESLPTVTRWVIGVADWIDLHLMGLVVVIVLLVWLHRQLLRLQIYRWLWEWPLLMLPLVGQLTRLQRLIELGQGMSSYLSLGFDLPAAADAVRRSSWSPWLNRRLKHFSQRVADGMPWHQAWEQGGLGNRLERWVVLNSGLREDPASGFHDLASLARRRFDYLASMARQLMPVLIVLIAGLIVGTMALALFMPLIHLNDGMTMF